MDHIKSLTKGTEAAQLIYFRIYYYTQRTKYSFKYGRFPGLRYLGCDRLVAESDMQRMLTPGVPSWCVIKRQRGCCLGIEPVRECIGPWPWLLHRIPILWSHGSPVEKQQTIGQLNKLSKKRAMSSSAWGTIQGPASITHFPRMENFGPVASLGEL
eukprot:scaffold243648_cov16-Prasinocladus_malaysianus.AAC.1